jgi:DNA-damage-inducible protein J
MTFSMRDANGFTPAEAAELKRRIDDVTAGNVSAHSIIEA